MMFLSATLSKRTGHGMVIPTQELTSLSSSGTTCIGLQEWLDASLVQPASEESLNSKSSNNSTRLCPIYPGEGKHDSDRETAIGRIPVVSKNGTPLMPCRPAKARKLIAQGKAIKKRNKIGIFYLHLQFDPHIPVTQPLAIGVDPGTKYEGFSVVGTGDTVVNIMSEAITWVKRKVEQRRNARKARRKRNTRRRKNKKNRIANQRRLPPSTRARWDVKLRIIKQLCTIIPIQNVVVEDIQAVTKKRHHKRWNTNFSPLEVGKWYFYSELQKLKLNVILAQGNETQQLRQHFGLHKKKSKSQPIFETHCVDAWVLAAATTRAKFPTTISIYYITPLQFHRRQLHRFQFAKGGIKRRYGGTLSLGLKKGTLVTHKTLGLCYIGGNLKNRLSLHCLKTGKRLTQNAKKEDCTILTRISLRTQFLSPLHSEYS